MRIADKAPSSFTQTTPVKSILIYLSIIIAAFIIYEALLKEIPILLSQCIIFCFVCFSVFIYLIAIEDSLFVYIPTFHIIIQQFLEKAFSQQCGLNYIICFCLLPLMTIASLCIVIVRNNQIFSYLSNNYNFIFFAFFIVALAFYILCILESFTVFLIKTFNRRKTIKYLLFIFLPGLGLIVYCSIVGIQILILLITFSLILYCIIAYRYYIRTKNTTRKIVNEHYKLIGENKFFDRSIFDEVLTLYRKQKYKNAKSHLDEIVRADKAKEIWPYKYVYIGRIYWKIGYIDEAISSTRKALSVKENPYNEEDTKEHQKCPRALKCLADYLLDKTLIECRLDSNAEIFNENAKIIKSAIRKLKLCSPEYYFPQIDHLIGCFFLLRGLKNDKYFPRAIKKFMKCIISDDNVISRYYLAIILMINTSTYIKAEYHLRKIEKRLKREYSKKRDGTGRLLVLTHRNLDRVKEARNNNVIFNKRIVYYCNDLDSDLIPPDCQDTIGISNISGEIPEIKLFALTLKCFFFPWLMTSYKRN